jgi:cytochrome P450
MIPALHSEEMTKDELVATALLVLFAGGDTTTNLITNGLLAIVNHPQARDRLGADSTLFGSAVEEIARYDSPVQMVLRYSTADTCVGGTEIERGAAVALLLGAANRDPARFEDPDRFDVGRNPNPHVAFGDGIHRCFGGHLARLQAQIAIRGLLQRFPGLRLRDPDAPLQYSASLLSRGLARLSMTVA